MADVILHHYDTSPFSEKVRVLLGVKGLSWSSVIQPVIMPKPDLVPLTGGYRRIPVMQIGADIFLDSQVIMAELERIAPEPAVIRGGGWGVNLWADRLWFQATVAVVFGEIGDQVPQAFKDDREKLSGRLFDTKAMAAAAGPMRSQWRGFAAQIDDGLGHEPFLGGGSVSLEDIAAYMNIWWLHRACPGPYQELTQGLRRLAAWRSRMIEFGHGDRTEMESGEALAIARESEPGEAPAHDPDDASGLPVGAAVTVSADDYGRDPIAGRLVSATARRIVIERQAEGLGRLNVHFPRVGYLLSPAA